MGTVLATVVVTALQMIFPDQAFLQTGWRVAFWLALPLLLFGFWVRHGIEESPVFQAAQRHAAEQAAEAPRSSILEALSKPRAVLHGLGVRLGENIAFYFYTVFVLSFATKVHKYAMPDVLKVVTLGSVAQFAGMIFAGWFHVERATP